MKTTCNETKPQVSDTGMIKKSRGEKTKERAVRIGERYSLWFYRLGQGVGKSYLFFGFESCYHHAFALRTEP